ncbi:MAG: hypothetical protein KatS3mg105_1059 [Gemmatales bacterium]|nr:MAG: hypothetical protein KatS3mg105_1059 [Gemmatales bacterium]
MTSDWHLLEEYRLSRNSSAFEEIVRRHGGMVHRTAARLLGDLHEAEDVMQSVFMALAQRPKAVKRSVAGWLHEASRRVAKKMLRSRVRRRDKEKKGSADFPPDRTNVAELREELDTALANLPADLREAVILRYLEGRSQDEAAQLTGCPRSTLVERSTVGLRRLRAILMRRGVVVSEAALVAFFAREASLAAAKVVAGTGASTTFGQKAVASSAWAGKTKAALWSLATAAMLGTLVVGVALKNAKQPVGSSSAVATSQADSQQRESTAKPDSVPEPGARGDRLILKTMDQKELLEFILDTCEATLPEYESAWVQEKPGAGYWKHLSRENYQGVDKKDENIPTSNLVPACVYAFLLLERPKPKYAGKYDRELLERRFWDYVRNPRKSTFPERSREAVIDAPQKGKAPGNTVWEYLLAYLGHRLKTGSAEPPRYRVPKNVQPVKFDEIIAKVKSAQGRPCDMAYNNLRHDPGPIFWSELKDVRKHPQFLLAHASPLVKFNPPYNRAINWKKLIDRPDSPPLNVLFADRAESLAPDYSTQHHAHFSWLYLDIKGEMHGGGLAPGLFAAATAGRPLEQLPPSYFYRNENDVGHGVAGYIRNILCPMIAADGQTISPLMAEYFASFNFLDYLAWDACLNRYVPSAVCLGRHIQWVAWNLRRPFAPLMERRGRYEVYVYTLRLLTVYYMIKAWGLPEKLPDWQEMLSRDGGVVWLPYHNITVHRNPYRVLQVYGGLASRKGFWSPFGTVPDLKIHFSPSPWQDGHSMELTRGFISYGGTGPLTSLYSEYFNLRKLPVPEEYKNRYRNTRRVALLGSYGGDGSYQISSPPAAMERWDDGFRLSYATSRNVKRALFSLGGKMLVVMETNKGTEEGQFCPIPLYIQNLEYYSKRAGKVPPVSWRLRVDDEVIRLQDKQQTSRFSPHPLGNAVRWYNLNEQIGVVSLVRRPLVLSAATSADVADTLHFASPTGGDAVIYCCTTDAEMQKLATTVRPMTTVPAGWRGLYAQAPEGYWIFTWVRFEGNAGPHHLVIQLGKSGLLPGAPVFSKWTTVQDGTAKVTIALDTPTGTWSEEPRFYVSEAQGAVELRAFHHRLELRSRTGGKVRLRFFSGNDRGKVRVDGSATWNGSPTAESLRKDGFEVILKPNESVWLQVSETGRLSDDRTGPFVVLAEPKWEYRAGQPGRKEYAHQGLAIDPWQAVVGKLMIRAEAADRFGIKEVHFYLNRKLVGKDNEAPYECVVEVKNRYCQYVYAVAYDHAGNKAQSYYIPFGDGSIAPPPPD